MDVTQNISFIPKTWELPAAITNRLGVSAGRQRVMDEEGHLLIILHVVPQPEDDARRRGVYFWRNPQGEWKSAPERGGLKALESHINSYAQAIHAIDEAVDQATRAEEYFEALQKAHPLLRATRNLLAVLQSAREARRGEQVLISLRDQAVDLERAIDLATQDAKAAMEYSLAKSAQDQSREAHKAVLEARRLNLLVAFFFPLATLVAVFGMNDPLLVLSSGFVLPVVGAGIMIGAMVLGLVLRGRGR